MSKFIRYPVVGPTSHERDQRYDRQIKNLRWLAWGLAWLILGIILGHLICGK